MLLVLAFFGLAGALIGLASTLVIYPWSQRYVGAFALGTIPICICFGAITGWELGLKLMSSGS